MPEFKLLLENGANPNVVTINKKNLLLNKVLSNNTEAVYYLYAVKANPNIIDEIGNIPLDYARNNDIRDLLLAMGSNPNHKNYLIYALQNKNARFFESLLEMGANVNKANEQGKTPIFYATTKRGNSKIN